MLSALKRECLFSSSTPAKIYDLMIIHFAVGAANYFFNKGLLFYFFLFPLRFGPPFLMREDRCISWDQLQQSILSKLYYLMINGAQAQVFFLKQFKFKCLFILASVNFKSTFFNTAYGQLHPQAFSAVGSAEAMAALRLCAKCVRINSYTGHWNRKIQEK